MRLTDDQAQAIRTAAREAFGAGVIVRLFGSRADDSARGGDIDLHIDAPVGTADGEPEVRFRAALWQLLDEPQLDVVVHEQGTPLRWIDRAALREGVPL